MYRGKVQSTRIPVNMFRFAAATLAVAAAIWALAIGLLGGFTTFSSFGLQTFTLLRDGEVGLALFNIAISNAGGLLMVWVGYSLAKIL